MNGERVFLSERDQLILEKLETANALLATILAVVVAGVDDIDTTIMAHQVLSSLVGVN